MIIRIRKPCYEDFAVFFLSLSYVLHIFNLTLRKFVGNTHKIDTACIYGLLFIVLLFVLQEAVCRLRMWQLVGILSVIVAVVVGMLFSSNIAINIKILRNVCLQCFPMFLCGSLIYDYSDVRKKITNVMTIIPYFYLAMMIFFGLNILAEDESYSQTESYSMLFISIVLTSTLFEKFSIKHLIPLIISMFFMIAYGARGPLACWGIYVVLKLIIRLNHENLLRKVALIVFLIIVGVIVYKYFYTILLFLKELFNQLGLSVRVVDKLLDNSYTVDTERNKLVDICLERIKSNPFIGTGPINDRIYIANHLHTSDIIGNYPHNIFLELLLQYGVIIGAVLIILFMWIIIKSYRIAPNKETKEFVLILVGSYLFPLLFSKSYLDYNGFYLLIAACIGIVKKQQEALQNIQEVECVEQS